MSFYPVWLVGQIANTGTNQEADWKEGSGKSCDGTGPLAPYRSDRESRKPTIDNVGRFVLKCLGVGEPMLRWLTV